MKITAKRAAVIYALIGAFLIGVIILVVQLVLHGSAWASNKANRHIYSNGTVVNTGAIYDRNGVVLAESVDNERSFAKSAAVRKSVLHIVGDSSGFISTGTHYLYRDVLSGYNLVGGIYKLKKDKVGTDITLNIDSEANKIAYDALGKFNGAVAVYNYKTGELLCSVSKPAYDVNDVPKDLLTNPKYEGVFLDKVISGVYTPGSIMKIVTAACAIENIPDIESRSFECDGEYEFRDGSVICNDVHGTISFQQAMNESCNSVFAELAVELGAEKLLATAEALGFNKQLTAREIRIVKSRFNPSKTSIAELGWAGIGQSTTYVNPTHFLMLAGAIANGGNGYAPERIKSAGALSKIVGRMPETVIKMNPATAQRLDEMLRSNIRDCYGDYRFPSLEMCGKTGTAQQDNADSHSWFVGYSQRSDLPLAVVCVAENAGSGMRTAVSVSNAVMQYFLKNFAE